MIKRIGPRFGGACIPVFALIMASPALAQQSVRAAKPAQDDSNLADIVVTAQKRAQSINDVGLSITAVDAKLLERRGIQNVYDLIKIVPGLSIANAGNGATLIYTLRGIGFNSSNFGATPTVSVYIDEVALPYPALSQGVALDLERVEVYKGPQGTLYGQNSTAGAINYIAAKPTDTFSAGVTGGYGRFNWWDVTAFASGPVSDTLKVRVAASHSGGNGWQKSYTRNDRLGKRDRSAARLIADWDAAPLLSVKLALNYWRDNSDSQALQLVRYVPLQPPGLPGLAAYPVAPADPRATDWSPDKRLKLDSRLVQPSLRLDWKIADDLTLTSLSTYSDYKTNSYLDIDGTTFEVGEVNQFGFIRDFNQELRLSKGSGKLRWVVGASYQRNKINENDNLFTRDLSNTQNIAGSGFGIIFSPIESRQKTDAKAVFANAEYQLSNRLNLVLGGRYTDTSISFHGCSRDEANPVANAPIPGVTASTRGFFNILYGALTGNAGAQPVGPGDCATLDNISRGGAPATFLPTDSRQKLSEDNFSWNATLNFKPNGNLLVYGRVAQGYKSGTFPTLGASVSSQYNPARQEGLRAYEAGFKATLLERKLQVDAAVFYYDYKDKQLANFISDPIFGPLTAIVNVPKSRVSGGELAVAWAPIQGLRVGGALTYIDTKITRFTGFDENGIVRDFSGSRFALAPKWSGSADCNYDIPVSGTLTASLGGGLTYRSASTGVILVTANPDYAIKAYTTFDAQVGIASTAGWNARIWGKNIGNKYYWSNVNRISDVIVRVAGLPATYGVTVGYRF